MLIWKRNLPKCNLRMAQGTKCLHAISNYMRKVKLKYQHVPPYPTLTGNLIAFFLTIVLNIFHRFCCHISNLLLLATNSFCCIGAHMHTHRCIHNLHLVIWSNLQRAGEVEPRGIFILPLDSDVF